MTIFRICDKISHMLNIKKARSATIVTIVILTFISFIIAVFNAFMMQNMTPGDFMIKEFSNIGDHFAFNTSGGATLLSSLLFYSLIVISLVLFATYALLLTKTKNKGLIADIVLFTIVSIMSLLFISNFDSLYRQQIINGDVFLVFLFTMLLVSYVAFLPLILINYYSFLYIKKPSATETESEDYGSFVFEEQESEETVILNNGAENNNNLTLNVCNNYNGLIPTSSNTSVHIEQESSPEIVKTKKTTTRKITAHRKDFETRFKSTNPDAERTWQSVDKFAVKIKEADHSTKQAYNTIKHTLLEYGLQSRVTNNGDVFRLNKKSYCKISILSGSMKVFLALDKKHAVSTVNKCVTVSNVDANKETPICYKIMKPDYDIPRVMALIKAMCEADNLIRVELIQRNYHLEIIA